MKERERKRLSQRMRRGDAENAEKSGKGLEVKRDRNTEIMGRWRARVLSEKWIGEIEISELEGSGGNV